MGARGGLRAHVRSHLRMAAEFEGWVEEDSRFEVVAPRTSALVCFRPTGSDDQAQALLDAVNAGGEMYLTHCVLPRFDAEGRRQGSAMALRMAIGGMNTRQQDVARAWAVLTEELDKLREDRGMTHCVAPVLRPGKISIAKPYCIVSLTGRLYSGHKAPALR